MAWACKKPKEEEEEEEEEEGAIVDASQIQLKADEEPVDCTPKMGKDMMDAKSVSLKCATLSRSEGDRISIYSFRSALKTHFYHFSS